MDESTIVPACKSCVLHLHIKLDAGFAPSMFTLRTGLMVTCLLVPENDRSGNYLELLNVLVCYVFATMTSLSALTYERVRKQQGSVFPINCLGLPAVVGPKTQIRCSAGQANTASAPVTRPVCFLMLCNQSQTVNGVLRQVVCEHAQGRGRSSQEQLRRTEVMKHSQTILYNNATAMLGLEACVHDSTACGLPHERLLYDSLCIACHQPQQCGHPQPSLCPQCTSRQRC